MTDINTIYNNKITRIIEIENDISLLNKKHKQVENGYSRIMDSIYELKYEYDTKYIVELLDIREDSKDKIVRNVKNLHIFSKNSIGIDMVVIKYTFGSSVYKIIVYRRTPIVDIYKDDLLFKTYDVVKEFKPMNFTIVDKMSILDNYVNLFVTDIGLRFGMMLMAYYTLIFYTLDMINEDCWEETVCKNHILRLMFIFNNVEYVG